jgi:lipopolysaccharide/colanic/teichoic acid biosynthesis glycosyltransferase
VVVASVALAAMAPAFLFVAAIVRMTGKPIIHSQTRVGRNGATFTIYKFRTMHVGAEREGEVVWAKERDPRATSMGSVLRKMRLDEMPQFWNVLRGDMSIVGPRPERPEFVAQLEQELPFWSPRALVKPGITGWAQVRRGYAADVESSADKLSYDFWYLRHGGVLVDLAICAQTLGILVRGGTPVRRRIEPPRLETPLVAAPDD